MQPEWRLILDLDDQRAADPDRAGDHDDENRRPVAGIDEGIIEPADFAIGPQVDESREQLALAAARASAGKPAQRALQKGRRCLVGHVVSEETKRAALRPPLVARKLRG